MKIIIDKTQSKIMDYLSSLDQFDIENVKTELSLYEREIFEPIFADLNLLKTILDKYKEEIDKYHISLNGISLLQKLYVRLLNNEIYPKSINEYFNLLKDIPVHEKRQVLISIISDKEIDENDFGAFFKLVDTEVDNKKNKWKAIWIYQNINQCMDELKKIFQEFLPHYETFYKKYEKSVDIMIKDFDPYKYFENSPVDLKKIITDMKVEMIRVFVKSSLNPSMIMSANNGTLDLYVYPLSQEILDKRKSFDDDILNIAIKALSDPIRYDILREVTSSNLMNKEIAEKLAITPANVSFHIQKLINSNLLKISMENADVKYKINSELIKALIQKFEMDLL